MNETCFWRWRFQPVFGIWGHLGIDYTFDDPNAGDFLLRHVDFGLPGDRANGDYRQSIGLYSAMIGKNGDGWPPLRTPFGRVFETSEFHEAPRTVGEFLQTKLPRFWGSCGAYRTWGPNSNTGLRRAIDLCQNETGYRFATPPWRMRVGAWGWHWSGTLTPHNGPCPGYTESMQVNSQQEVPEVL